MTYHVNDPGNVEGSYAWDVTETKGWLTGVSPAAHGSATLAAGGSQTVTATLAIPGSCPSNNADTVRFISRDLNVAGRADTCVTVVYCTSNTGTPLKPTISLFFAPPSPNPSVRGARLSYGLTRDGMVRLEIFAANGARVRTLVDGRTRAGAHDVVWDGRDERGRRVHAGVYYASFRAEGRQLGRILVMTP